MLVVTDIETNALENPDKIWVICCKEVNSGVEHVFERVSDDPRSFLSFNKGVTCHIGHNFLGYDALVLNNLLGPETINTSRVIDTLIFSRLVNYNIKGGHSLEAWGERLKIKKQGIDISAWSTYIPLMKERCLSDIRINLRLYQYLSKYLTVFKSSLRTEHDLQLFCNTLKSEGFPFDYPRALSLRDTLLKEITPLDDSLKSAFPPKSKFIKEVTPRTTKSGSINLSDFRFLGKNPDLSPYSEGSSFSVFEFEEFNPGSYKQIISRLNEAGWKPTEKTKGHIEAIRDKAPKEVLEKFKEFGWKVSEENLKTLPDTAPEATKNLVRRLILASRLSDVEEWIALAELETPQTQQGRNDTGTCLESARKTVQTDSNTVGYGGSQAVEKPAVQPLYAIHGNFLSIGSWTHRMAHQKPNMANIPIPYAPGDITSDLDREVSEINRVMRQLFTTRKGRRLVGVDADGIQMRIFAHVINETALIKALMSGDKKFGTDIHSVHWGALGRNICKSRDAAKTFIYAFLLGAGVGKVADILECSVPEAKIAIENFLEFYPGLRRFQESTAKDDFRRGYFIGLDGRYVAIPEERKVLAGYLQNGEKVIMARAAVKWFRELKQEGIPFWIRNFVHDEWQTETLDDEDIAERLAEVQINAIRSQAEELNLRCPLDGNRKFGYSWEETH